MKRRLLLGIVCLAVVAIVVASVVPATRYRLLAWVRHEPLVNSRPIGYWLGALKDEDPKVRRQAALSLGDADVCKEDPKNASQCQGVVVALAEMLGDADGFVRKCAATSFLLYPREVPITQEQALAGHLTGALGDPEVVVRKAAARALWQVNPPLKEDKTVARLIEALNDKSDYVRAYAARVLARIGPDGKAAVPALLERLHQDDDVEVRTLAGKTLGLMGAPAIGALLPEVVAGLTQGLKNEYTEFRVYAARALGQLGAKEAIPALQKATKDSDPEVRAAAAEALKRVQAPEKTP